MANLVSQKIYVSLDRGKNTVWLNIPRKLDSEASRSLDSVIREEFNQMRLMEVNASSSIYEVVTEVILSPSANLDTFTVRIKECLAAHNVELVPI